MINEKEVSDLKRNVVLSIGKGIFIKAGSRKVV